MSNANHTTSGASWQPPQGGQGASGWQPPQGRPAGSPGDYERYSTRFFSWIRESGLTRGDERWIGGVCGGLASYLGWSPMLVRALMVGAVLVCGIGAAFYGLAWFLLPDGRDGRILCEELMGARWDWSCVGVLVCLVATIFWPGMWIFGLGVGASALWLIVWSCVNRRNEADANRWRAQGNAAPGYAAGAAGGYAGYAAGAGAGGYASGADGGYATGAAGYAAGAGAAGYAAGAAGGYAFRQETGAPAPGASVFDAAAPGVPASGSVSAPQGMGNGGGASGSASGGVPVFGGTADPGGAANPYGAGTPNGGPDPSVPTAPDGASAHGPASEPGLTRNDGAAPVPSGPRGEADSADDAAAAPGAVGTTAAVSDAADGGTATVGDADGAVADGVVAAADDVTVDAAAAGAAAVDGAVVDAAAVAAPVAVSGRNADAVDPADGAGDGTTGDDTAGDGAIGDAIHADADPAARAARFDDVEPSAAPGTRLDDAESSAVPGARPGDAGRQTLTGPSGPAVPPARPIPSAGSAGPAPSGPSPYVVAGAPGAAPGGSSAAVPPMMTSPYRPSEPQPKPRYARRKPAGPIVVLVAVGAIFLSFAAVLMAWSYGSGDLETLIGYGLVWTGAVCAVLGLLTVVLGCIGRRSGGLTPFSWIAACLVVIVVFIGFAYSTVYRRMLDVRAQYSAANDSGLAAGVNVHGYAAIGSDPVTMQRLGDGLWAEGDGTDDILHIDLSEYGRDNGSHAVTYNGGGLGTSTCPAGLIRLAPYRTNVVVTIPDGCSWEFSDTNRWWVDYGDQFGGTWAATAWNSWGGYDQIGPTTHDYRMGVYSSPDQIGDVEGDSGYNWVYDQGKTNAPAAPELTIQVDASAMGEVVVQYASQNTLPTYDEWAGMTEDDHE